MDDSLFVDILLWVVYLALGATFVTAVWSAVHGVRESRVSRPASFIGYVVAAAVLLLLVVTYMLASTQPVVSNGHPFTDVLWLRLTDMFIVTSILLIGLCSVLVAVAKFRR